MPESGCAYRYQAERTIDELITSSHCPAAGGAWAGKPDLVVGFHE